VTSVGYNTAGREVDGATFRDADNEVVMVIPKGQYQSIKRIEGQ